jgi:hypothetical protein
MDATKLKTRYTWNVIISRKWVTKLGIVDFDPIMFLREK